MTALADILQAEITASGPMRLDAFMAACLMHPRHGYYSTRDPFGEQGDFITAPEISQMFGELVGLCLAQTWLDQGAPNPVALVELGPGRGTLMADALRATRGFYGNAWSTFSVELLARHRAAGRGALYTSLQRPQQDARPAILDGAAPCRAGVTSGTEKTSRSRPTARDRHSAVAATELIAADRRADGVRMMRALLVALLAAGVAARARVPEPPYRRRLSGGAMTELNRLLGELTFNIPDQQFTIVTPTIAVKDIDTTITGLSCTKLGIGALDFRAAKPDEQQVDLAITVSGITAECSCDWSYVYIWDGKGTARAVATAANANRLSTSVTFRSADFSTSLPIMYPPPEVGSCGIDFHFQPMKFDGKNVGGDLVQLFDGTVQDKIEDQLNSIACTSLGDLVPNLLATVIAALNEEIEPLMYFMNLTFARDDALISERQLVDTAECTARSCPFPWLLPSLVQMRQNWIVNMLQLGAVKLNSPSRPSCKPDWQGATRCSGPLVVNDVISFITGGTGSVVIANFFDLFQWNSTIVSGDETFSEEIRIKSLKITGLDTFTRFDTMHVIGNFTVMNALTMEYLGVEVDADVVLRPSADDSSTVVSKHGAISEHVILHTGLRNASVELAGMLAIYKTATEIKLGDMAQHPLGCIFAKVYDANLTFANVTVGGVTHPTFQGFTGVDSLLNGVADAAFLMYEEVAEKILPGAMQTSVRASLNNLTAMYLAAPENLVCPPRPRSASLVYMDFTKENVTLELAWLLQGGRHRRGSSS